MRDGEPVAQVGVLPLAEIHCVDDRLVAGLLGTADELQSNLAVARCVELEPLGPIRGLGDFLKTVVSTRAGNADRSGAGCGAYRGSCSLRVEHPQTGHRGQHHRESDLLSEHCR